MQTRQRCAIALLVLSLPAVGVEAANEIHAPIRSAATPTTAAQCHEADAHNQQVLRPLAQAAQKCLDGCMNSSPWCPGVVGTGACAMFGVNFPKCEGQEEFACNYERAARQTLNQCLEKVQAYERRVGAQRDADRSQQQARQQAEAEQQRNQQQRAADQLRQQHAAEQKRQAEAREREAAAARIAQGRTESLAEYQRKQEETRQRLSRELQTQKELEDANARDAKQSAADRQQNLTDAFDKVKEQMQNQIDKRKAEVLAVETRRLEQELRAADLESERLNLLASIPRDAPATEGPSARDMDAGARTDPQSTLVASMPSFDDLQQKSASLALDQGARAAVGAWDSTLGESIEAGQGWADRAGQLAEWAGHIADLRSGGGDPLTRATFITEQAAGILFRASDPGAAGVAGYAFGRASSTAYGVASDVMDRLQRSLDASNRGDRSEVNRASDFSSLNTFIGASMCDYCARAMGVGQVVRGTWYELASLFGSGNR